MTLFRTVVQIDAPPGRVWQILCDWDSSDRWMVDKPSVTVLTPEREGEGMRMRAVSRLAGIRLIDEMTVTAWQPERLIQVRHERPPIRGIAWFALAPRRGGTRFEWGEDLTPPLGALGRAGGAVLKPAIEGLLARGARNLKTLAEKS